MALSVIIHVAVGALLIAISIPLARRRVAPNPTYGLRTRATLADPEVWYEANASSGRDMIRVGAAVVVLALGLALVPGITENQHLIACAAALLGGVVGVAVVGSRRAARMLRERSAGAE
ncbi:MAG TPA: SdpI family protein [Longimicrobium sp.]|nr:SdpI family protein [Longimicrobium sp.]